MLTSVLLLMSCSAQKKLTSSASATQASHLLYHLDSVVSAEVRLEVERLCETGLESSTDMVIYDTERIDSVGNAPVKAVLAQRTRRQERSQERAGGQETRLAGLESEQQRDSTAAARQETSENTSRKTGKTPTACALLVMAALAAAGYIVYKRKTKQT